jgi:4a-hydroxytetrahydrobiopterin dehydratase
MASLLDDTAIQTELTTLTDWHGNRSGISRHVHLPQSEIDGFLAALERVAREMDHDPDLDLADSDLTITMSTHSAGGVTDLDIAYARRVDALLS